MQYFDLSTRDSTEYGKFKAMPPSIGLLLSRADKAEPVKSVIFLVHGYNNVPVEVESAYKLVRGHIAESRNLVVFGYHWPSDGRVTRYLSDRRDARKAGSILAGLIKEVRETTPSATIGVISHSMGAYVVANALVTLVPGVLDYWVCQAGDIARRRLEPDGKWGKHAGKLKSALFIYSRHDTVLKYPAKLVIPRFRVGELGLPAERPLNFVDLDANLLTESKDGIAKVRHGDYKHMGDLQRTSFMFARGHHPRYQGERYGNR